MGVLHYKRWPLIDLAPQCQYWNNGEGIDLESWIHAVGRFDYAIGYADLFWPEFVEHDNCVFFVGFSEENYRRSMETMHSNKMSVEAFMNHVHIGDLFSSSLLSNNGTEPERAQVECLGEFIREMWSAKLARDFPKRVFEVPFLGQPADPLSEYYVTFYQPDNSKVPVE